MRDLKERLRKALRRDFKRLYVKEFTTWWREQRFIRNIEIGVMQLSDTEKLIETLLQEERKGLRKDVKELMDRYAYNLSELTIDEANDKVVIDVEILEEYLRGLTLVRE